MAELKIYARVADIYAPRTGTSQDGNPWSLQDIIVEEPDNKYPTLIATVIDNYRTSPQESKWIEDSLTTGKMLTLSCSVSSRKWTGKDGRTGFSTNVKVFRIEEGDTRNTETHTQRNAQPNVVRIGGEQPAAQATAPQSDDLPWE